MNRLQDYIDYVKEFRENNPNLNENIRLISDSPDLECKNLEEMKICNIYISV